MRLEPSEEFMYRRMDQKDQMRIMIPVFGIMFSLGFLLLSSPATVMTGVAVLIGSVIGIGGCIGLYVWLKRRIMPLVGCYLEIQTTCFVAVQPFLDSQYESCKIYYKDVEAVVKERKNKGFYLKIKESGESTIRGKGSDMRRILFISPFGYSKEGIGEMYEIFKKRVSEKTNIYEYV